MKKNYRVAISRDGDYYEKSVQSFGPIVGSLKNLPAVMWKYHENPYGECQHFVVVDENDAILAQLGNLPRPLVVNGKSHDGVQSVDVVVAEESRGQGLFKCLSSTCKENQRDQKMLLAIYVASTDMSYRGVLKAGYHHAGKFDMYRRIVRPFSAICEKVFGVAKRNNIFVRSLDNLVFKSLRRKVDVSAHFVGRFDVDVAIDNHLAHWARGVDYLNWRYADNVAYKFHLGVCKVDKRDIGYFAFRLNDEGSAAYLYDFYSSEKMSGCIVALTNLIGESLPGVNRISYRCIGRKVVDEGFRQAGYSRSPYDLNMFLDGTEETGLNLDNPNWYISIGDSDW